MPNPPLWAILIFLMVLGTLALLAVALLLDKIWGWSERRRQQAAVKREQAVVIVPRISRSRGSRPATMGEILDSITWPWTATPRESVAVFDQHTARTPGIVGGGRGRSLV